MTNLKALPGLAIMALAICVGEWLHAQPCFNWMMAQTPVYPSSRSGHAMAYDASRGYTVLVGGWNGSVVLDDAWEWNGQAWHELPFKAPSPRTAHAMVHDSGRNVVVLFGGKTSESIGVHYGDTWELHDRDWILKSMSGPSPRSTFAMAYDSSRGVTVLFGGTNGQTALGDTWEWNGSSWALRAIGGPARSCHAMAFDEQRKVVVMFGGSSGFYLNDTWEWNGQTWSQKSSGGLPARCRCTMTFDSTRNRTVLFGGVQLGGGSLSDTWAWNGTSWVSFGTGAPTARFSHGMAYDSQRDQTIVFGGVSGTESHDTWTLSPRPPAILQSPTSADVQAGQPVQLSVFAIAPGYQWRRNQVPLSDMGNISGTLTSTLTINPATMADAGTYDVVVSNVCGSTISAAALLKVHAVGDVNGSGSVDIDDVLAVIQAWGPCPALPAVCPADVDHNDTVNIDDLLTVIGNWSM